MKKTDEHNNNQINTKNLGKISRVQKNIHLQTNPSGINKKRRKEPINPNKIPKLLKQYEQKLALEKELELKRKQEKLSRVKKNKNIQVKTKTKVIDIKNNEKEEVVIPKHGKQKLLFQLKYIWSKIFSSVKSTKLYNVIDIKLSNNIIFSNRRATISFIIILLLITVLTQSFAWLYDEFLAPGADITVGTISHSVRQYNKDGELLTEDSETNTLIYETNMSNTTKNSKFIEINNTGTLDLEYSLNFLLEGTIDTTGVLFYRIYEVTGSVDAINQGLYDSKIEAYAHNNPISPSIETDTDYPINNMSLITNNMRIGTIESGGHAVYRVDYGMYSSVNTSRYSNDSFSIHLSVYSSQVGVVSNENREGTIWEVQNEAQFREILLSAVAGDTIKLIDNININGSVDISSRINIDTNGNDLNITGDLLFDFVNMGDLIIDASGTGHLIVGNDLVINTPNADVTIEGNNKNYDIVVNGEFSVNSLLSESNNGLFLENVRIVKSNTTFIPVDIYVESNTRITVGPEVEVGYIFAKEDTTNIEVINNGFITQIDLSLMELLDTYTKYQIYVYNLGEIYGAVGGSSILLPSEATPYVGPNNGNTVIIRGITSGSVSVSGADNFGIDDITANDDDVYVVPLDGEDDSYIIYIKDSLSTVQGLLNDYFTIRNENPVTKTATAKKLIIYTLNAQYLENEDFDYMKSSAMESLEYLDLSHARVIDGTTINRIKSNAMNGKTSLQTVILPNYLDSIGSYAFYNCQLGSIPAVLSDFNFLSIPSTVESIEANAFNAARFVKFKGTNDIDIALNAFGSNSRIFVVPGTESVFMDNSSLNSAHIYTDAVLSDDGRYFIYENNNGVGISYIVNNYLSGNTFSIPNIITYLGSNKNTTSIGVNAFRELDIASSSGQAAVVLPSTVLEINDYAFYNLNITSISLNNVIRIGSNAFRNTQLTTINAIHAIEIGDYAFENSLLQTVYLNDINEIGNYAFANLDDLYEIDLGVVSVVGDYAFYNCPSVIRVYIDNGTSRMVNNTETVDLVVGDNAFFSSWGSYVDGRLRFYVPTTSSSSGRSLLSLYKNMFYDNQEYIFVQGNDIGTYTHLAVPYNLSEYTVRMVTLRNAYNEEVTGLEIISYQGADITADIPNNLTYNGTPTTVISIGEGAYANASVVEDSNISLESAALLHIGSRAFEDLEIDHVVSDSVVSIDSYAFQNSAIHYGFFSRLNSLGVRSFYNCDELYRLKLGNVISIGNESVANTPNLTSVFFENESRAVTFASNAFDGAGVNLDNRFRIYVPEEEVYVNYYKGLFPDWTDYIYPTGTIVGHYYYGAINYDIGEYSIRQVTRPNKDGINVTDYEIIEYHGPDLNSDFTIPEILQPSLDALHITYNWTYFSNNRGNITFELTNTSDEQITNWQFDVALPGDMTMTGWSNGTNTITEDYVTIGPASYNRIINAGSKITFSSQFTRYDTNLESEIDILDIRATISGGTVSYGIISVGANAFSHTDTITGETFNFDTSTLLYVGENAFKNMSGLRQVTMNNLITIMDGAFENTTMTQGSFNNLNIAGANAFANSNNLAKLNFGKVQSLGSGAVTNAPHLYQIIFDAPEAPNLTISPTVFNNIGTSTSDRMRFYVTNGTALDGSEYVEIYKSFFPISYQTYFFAYDHIIGSFIPNGILDEIDIGEYAIREMSDNGVQGYEFVEYHGTALEDDYEFPLVASLSDPTLSGDFAVTGNSWGSSGSFTTPISFTIYNNGEYAIDSWKFVLELDAESGTLASANTWGNTGVSINGQKVTFTSISYNGIIQPGQSRTLSGHIVHSNIAFVAHVDLVRENAQLANELPVLSIGPYAFMHAAMASNEQISIDSDNVINIGTSAFENNIGLYSVTVPNCKTVGESAFKNSTYLTFANFPEMTSVGAYAFYNATNLLSIDLGLISILPDYLLAGTGRLARMYFNNRSYSIANEQMNMTISETAFNNMGSAAGNHFRIYVPDDSANGDTTYRDAYKNTFPTNLRPYIFEKGIDYGSFNFLNTGYDIGDFTIKRISIGGTTGWQMIEYHGDDIDDDFELPNQITIADDTRGLISIGSYAFYFAEPAEDCIWSLNLPTSIVYIGDYAFYQRDIYSISGASLSYIGKYAFAELPNIVSVVFNSVVLIDEYAFYRCRTLTMVNVGTGVQEIKNYAFYNSWTDNNLTQFRINTMEPPTIYQYSLPATYWYDSITTIYVPYEAYSDYAWATYWRNYDISYIGYVYQNKYLYDYINNNTEIKLIGYYGNDQNLDMPDYFTISNRNYNVTQYEPQSFDTATRLRNLTIGRYVKNVGNGFLENNDTIRNIYVDNQNEYFASTDGVLYDKSMEVLIRFPNVYNSSQYSTLSSTKVIASGSFSYAPSITRITFNSGLLVIDDNAFIGATNLIRIIFASSTPPYLTGFEPFPMNSGLTIQYPIGNGQDQYVNDTFFSWYSAYLSGT